MEQATHERRAAVYGYEGARRAIFRDLENLARRVKLDEAARGAPTSTLARLGDTALDELRRANPNSPGDAERLDRLHTTIVKTCGSRK